MNTSKIKLVAVVAFLSASNIVFGQGCSDAGFCTLHNFKPHNDSIEQTKNQLGVGLSYGNADNSINVYGAYVEYSRQLNDKFGLNLKLTSLGQTGNDISVFGLSDAFVNANYKATDKLNLTVGTKIPLTKGDKKHNNLPLPMDYQSSLGTFDLILGVGYKINKLQLVAALQQPLSQNSNAFLSTDYPLDSKLRGIHSTRNFKRAGDIMLRASYPFILSRKLTITPGILPIYHLQNDKYTDATNVEREIDGSKGLTLNGNVYLDYQLSEKSALQLNAGAPFIRRDARPDGLTRGFAMNLEYKIRF